MGREIVMSAVRQNGLALQYATDALRADQEIVLQAVAQHGHAFQHADVALRSSKPVVFEALMLNPEARGHTANHLRVDIDEVVRKNTFKDDGLTAAEVVPA